MSRSRDHRPEREKWRGERKAFFNAFKSKEKELESSLESARANAEYWQEKREAERTQARRDRDAHEELLDNARDREQALESEVARLKSQVATLIKERDAAKAEAESLRGYPAKKSTKNVERD